MNENQPSLTAWRDQAPDPSLRAKILDRVETHRAPRRLKFVFLGLAGSGALATFFAVGTLAGAAPMSLAQVISADSKAGSLTVTHRRIMGPDKGNGFTIRTRTAGATILNEIIAANQPNQPESVAYTDGKSTILYQARFHVAVTDQVLNHFTSKIRRPKLESLLKDFKHAKVEYNVDWNGRKVTRFSYKGQMKNTDFDEVLLADPRTNLPIRLLSMRDKGSWGDEWLYDYSNLDPASLKPTLPAGTEVIDNRQVRPQMLEWMRAAKGSVRVGQVSPTQIAFLVDAQLIDLNRFPTPFRFTLNLKSGEQRQFQGNFSPGMSLMTRVDGQDYAVLIASEYDLHWNLWTEDTVSGKLIINGKELEFKDLRLARSGELYTLNSPLIDAYNAAHPKKTRAKKIS